jgi:hypothetical protein
VRTGRGGGAQGCHALTHFSHHLSTQRAHTGRIQHRLLTHPQHLHVVSSSTAAISSPRTDLSVLGFLVDVLHGVGRGLAHPKEVVRHHCAMLELDGVRPALGQRRGQGASGLHRMLQRQGGQKAKINFQAYVIDIITILFCLWNPMVPFPSFSQLAGAL